MYEPGVAHDVILQWTAMLGSVVLCVVGLLFFGIKVFNVRSLPGKN